jgi:hypothetical protein
MLISHSATNMTRWSFFVAAGMQTIQEANDDCEVFIETMSSLFSVCKAKRIHSISEDEDYNAWLMACNEIRLEVDKSKRTLFIFFYAGYATKSSTSSNLILKAKYEDHEDGNFSLKGIFLGSTRTYFMLHKRIR